MNYLSFAEPCARPLSGFYGLGAALTLAQRQAKQAATKAAQLAKRTAAQQKRAAKKAVKVAGQTILTSNPAAAAALNAGLVSLKNTTSGLLVATAKNGAAIEAAKKIRDPKARSAAIAKGVANAKNLIKATQAHANKVQIAHNATPAAIPVKPALRGLGYFGTCQTDPSTGQLYDDGDGQGCDQSGGGAYVDPTTGQPLQNYGAPLQTGFPATTGFPLSTGLTPGFGLPSINSYAPRGCNAGSNLPRCLIFAMAQDVQQQYQFVFTILQQMYAQLLQIVQQLMAQLQSAQQQPYGYGQPGASPYGPYGQDPYGGTGSPYGYGDPAYGGQYAGPGYPGQPYYPGSGDSGTIPPGYGGDSGDLFAGGTPGDVSQIFPGPGPSQQGPYAQGPSQPTNIISSDSLPDGADQQAGDMWGGGGGDARLPAYTPAPQSMVSLPIQDQNSQSVTSGPGTPQLIVDQQSAGQSPYADAMIPAGPAQGSAQLEPPGEIEDWARGS